MADTPLKDKDYDLISVVYHAAQGAEICRQYAADAESEGDQDAARYFGEVREQNMRLVDEGKALLRGRM
jgi:hypothetical protein